MRTRAISLIVIIFVLGIALFSWWSTRSQEIFAKVESTLAIELSSALGTRVEIGKLKSAGITSAAVDHVTIFDKQGRQLAAAEQVVINYNLLSLINGNAALDAIKKVRLIHPQVLLVHEADGSWNIEVLKQKTKPDSPMFNSFLAIEQGSIAISTPQGDWEFTYVNGESDIKNNKLTNLKFDAQHNGSNINATGFVDTDNGCFSLTVKADSLKPAEYQGLLPKETDVKFGLGTTDNVDVTITKNASGMSYAGELTINNLSATVSELAVNEVQGRLTFTNNNVYIFGGKALVSGQPITASGQIAIDGNQPVMNLHVASSGLNPAVFVKNIPVSGLIALQGKFLGTIDNPVIEAELKSNQAIVEGYDLRALHAKARYGEKVLTVDSFSAQMLGGQVLGQGAINIDSQLYQLELTGKGLEAGGVKGLPIELSGKGDLTIKASGQGTSLAAANATVSVALGSGMVNGTPYNNLSGLIQHNGSLTRLEYFNLLLPSGLVASSGTLQGEALNLKVTGQGIEFRDIPAASIKDIKLTGTTNFEGEVTGTITAPRLALTFAADNLKVKEQLLGQANGQIKASTGEIAFEQVRLTDGIANHELTGKILLSGGEPAVDLKLVTLSARAETFVNLVVPDLKLTGNMDHEVTLSGPLSNLNISGNVKLTEGSLEGYLISEAHGSYERKNGSIIINNLEALSLNTKVKISGTIDSDNLLNLNVSADKIDIARLKIEYPYQVAGIVSLSGKVTNTVNNPSLSGVLNSPDIMLNGQRLQAISAYFDYKDKQFDINQLHFSQGIGSYVFGGSINLSSQAIDGILRVKGGEMAGILAIAAVPDRGIKGKLDGEVILSGNLTNPNVILRGAITDGHIKNYPLDTVDVDAELNNKVITVNKFIAKQGTDGMLVARGQAEIGGPMNFEVGGRDIQTGIIAALFDTNIETVGKFTFTAQATGLTVDPNVAVTLQITEGSVAGAEFDNLYGLFVYDRGSIHVNQLYIARGQYKASAYGTVPLKALNAQSRSQADITDRMDLKVKLDNADLSILPMLTKEVSWAAGPTTGEIAIGGTLAQPTLQGRVTVTQGTLKLKSLADPFVNVGVDIQFEGDKININTFDGEMCGGSYSIDGTANIRGLGLSDYNLMLTLKRLGIKHSYFSGPIDGVLSLTSQKNRPLISGKLSVDRATINIPTIPEGDPFEFDAGLDIEIVVGDKVRMYNPYLYDFQAQGKVKLEGTLNRPGASGKVEAKRGSVKYLTNRFDIKSGSAEFIQYRSIVPVIKLEATAKVSRTTIDLVINGPATAMDLKLSSNPEMSQQEIMSLLTLSGSYFSNVDASSHDTSLGRDELVSLLDAGLQMRFIAALENTMQNALGVDEFRFVKSSLFDNDRKDDNASDKRFQGYNIEVGKYLTDKFLLSYSMGLDQKKSTLSFRYDLTKRIGIGAAFGGTNREVYTVETRFSF